MPDDYESEARMRPRRGCEHVQLQLGPDGKSSEPVLGRIASARVVTQEELERAARRR